MSEARRTVEVMDANTPPTPGTPEHWAAWLDRYGDDILATLDTVEG